MKYTSVIAAALIIAAAVVYHAETGRYELIAVGRNKAPIILDTRTAETLDCGHYNEAGGKVWYFSLCGDVKDVLAEQRQAYRLLEEEQGREEDATEEMSKAEKSRQQRAAEMERYREDALSREDN